MAETEPHFMQYLQSTIHPNTSKDLVAKWRSHELQAIERGREIVHSISHLSKIGQACVLDIGSGYGGACIAFGESGAKVIGVDPFPHRVKGAKIRASLDYGQKGHILFWLLVKNCLLPQIHLTSLFAKMLWSMFAPIPKFDMK